MKKALLIVVIILVVVLALPIISLLRWTFQSKKPVGIVVVDKTVPTLDREKHKSFYWIMTNNRYVKKEKKTSYSVVKDYYGFHPIRPLKLKQYDNKRYNLVEALQELPEANDAVYFTDTRGVLFSDWIKPLYPPRRSRILVGGLNGTDNNFIKEMKDRNKLVVIEYNAFDWPTGEYEAYTLQNYRLAIKWSGWTGKYFATLDTAAENFPLWMTSMYKKQYKKPWSFNKPGIVLLRDKAIIVLEEGSLLTKALPVIITDSAYCAKWGIEKTVAFDQWFDIIDPMQNTVISKFKLGTTAKADSLLAGYGLTSEFPAVILDPVAQRTYYFSGDFCYVNIPYWTSRFAGVDKLKGFLYSKKDDDTRRFFWLYYKPLIEGIFGDYYTSMKAK
jgi:hypothetical protein